MNTLLANRVQSAYPRSSHRKETGADGDAIKQRPKTSRTTHRTSTDVFEQDPERSSINYRRRPKTANSAASARPASRRLRSDEIENLLQTLDRDDTCIVHLDCLANYRTLVETIDLRQTPLDCRVLCALQQRENRIVQGNACRDTRFHSLIDLLQPAYVSGRTAGGQTNEMVDVPTAEQLHNEFPVEYVK